MRCEMSNRKKIIAIALSVLYSFGFAPVSHAAGLPVLVWEAGKQEVISIRGVSAASNWELYLVGNGTSQKFAASSRSAQGSQMYEINLPKNQGLGSYIVEARSSNALTRQLAGINVVKMKQFNILQIPNKLLYICLAFILLAVGINTMRASQYARIEYLRPTRKRPKNIYLKRFFDFRELLLDELQPSLLKFQLTKEGELFHTLSPWIWALAPFIFFSFGAYIGTHSVNTASALMAPVLIYSIVSILGVLDPFSGIAAAIGFFIAISVSGAVTSIHTLLSAISFVSGWFVPGIIASLFGESIRRDWLPKLPRRFINLAPIVLSGIVGAIIFYAGELLTNSFSNQFGPVIDPGLIAPLAIGFVITIRVLVDQYLVRDLHMRGENYQIRTITLPRVIAPQSVIFATLYIFGAAYSWTGNMKFSFLISFVSAVSFGLLLFRFESSIFKSAQKIKRHILAEALLVIVIAAAIFFYVGTLPVTIVNKGELFVLVTGLLFLLHAIYSAVHDASTRVDSAGKAPHVANPVLTPNMGGAIS